MEKTQRYNGNSNEATDESTVESSVRKFFGDHTEGLIAAPFFMEAILITFFYKIQKPSLLKYAVKIFGAFFTFVYLFPSVLVGIVSLKLTKKRLLSEFIVIAFSFACAVAYFYKYTH